MTALRGLLTLLIGLLTSKKFVTGAVTAAVTTVIKDPVLATQVAAIGTAVVLGFAAQDVGKERAAIQEKADLERLKLRAEVERLKHDPELPEATP